MILNKYKESVKGK